MLMAVTAHAGTAGVVPTRVSPTLSVGETYNCEINISGTTATISGTNGAALTGSAPCYVGIRSTTTTVAQTVQFVQNVTFTFGASSDTDGNLWGITEANWTNSMPFFIGVVTNGTTPYFTLSRLPMPTSSYLSQDTDMCQKTDSDCDVEYDVMILATGLTLSNWTDKPVTQVGWIQATYATSGNAWTFAEGTNYYNTGFNFDYEKYWFTMAQGQNGAAASTHLTANGGTAPLFTTKTYVYNINRAAKVSGRIYFNADPGTDGAGAVQAQIVTPYIAQGSGVPYYFKGYTVGATTITGAQDMAVTLTLGTNLMTLQYLDASALRVNITNAMYSNGARTIGFNFEYQAIAF